MLIKRNKPKKDNKKILKYSKKLINCKEKLKLIKNNAKPVKNTTITFRNTAPSSLTNKKLEKKPSIFKLKYKRIKQTNITKV